MPISLHRCPNPACQYEDNPQDSQYCEACGNPLPSRPSTSGSSPIPPFASTNNFPTQITEVDSAHEPERESFDSSFVPQPIESLQDESVRLSPQPFSLSQPLEPVAPATTIRSDPPAATVHLDDSPQSSTSTPVDSSPQQPPPTISSAPPYPTEPLQSSPEAYPQKPARLVWQCSVRGVYPELEKLEYWIDRSPMTIGYFHRESGPVDIDINIIPGWEQTSPQHAQLVWDDQQWIIQDLGSQSGTFRRSPHNGRWEHLKVATPIIDHDQLSIGPLKFTFKMSEGSLH